MQFFTPTYRSGSIRIVSYRINKTAEDILFVVDSNKYKREDIDSLSEEEINYLKEKMEGYAISLGFDNIKKILEVSDVYDAGSHNWKYIFSKITAEYGSEKTTTIITTKRYTFMKENDTWKVGIIESDSVSYLDEESLIKDKILSNLKYEIVDNEKVPYIKTYDMLEWNK